MKKVQLTIEERLVYSREIVIEVPDEMSESELERALNKAERGEFIDEFLMNLRQHDIDVSNSSYDDDMSSPERGEVECTEYDFLEG